MVAAASRGVIGFAIKSPGDNESLPGADTLRYLPQTGYAALGIGGMLAAAVAMVTTSWLIVRTAVFGRWLAWLGVATALVVVVAIPFEDEADAIRIANDVKYGLFATVWTGDPARGHRVARAIKAGMVGVNTPYTAFPGIPFGGYKQSGFGRELSIDTLALYLETKGVLVSTSPKPFNPFRL